VIDTGCTFTGEIKIAYFDKITVTNQTYTLCESILTPNQAIFDLDSKKSAIIGTSNLKINNYLNSYGNPIDPSNYIGTNGEIIEVEVKDPNTGCVEKAELTLQTIPTSTDTITPPEPLIKDFSGNKNGITLMPLNTTDPFEFSLDGFNFQKDPLFYKRESFNDTFYILNTTSCKVAEGKYTILNHPTFFTPNEDIANDYWKINKLFDVDPDAKVIIFDRYGKYIKQFDSNTITNQGWDGKYNGAFLPADDYWFSVQFSNREAKGHFSLIR
jgi:gliding motility-associated-like protein